MKSYTCAYMYIPQRELTVSRVYTIERENEVKKHFCSNNISHTKKEDYIDRYSG